jgi:hypothetical protein
MGPLLAVLLLAGQTPPADGPISTKARPAVTPEQAATPLPGEAEYTPPGAPEDDYAFVGWCHGLLSGTRELATALKADLTRPGGAEIKGARSNAEIEADLEEIGRAYLKTYEQALLTAEMSRPRPATERALAAREVGYSQLKTALAAAAKEDRGAEETQSLILYYSNLSVPARCEHASKRLLANGLELSDAYKLAPLAGAAPPAAVQPRVASAEPEPEKTERKSLWSRITRLGRD